MIGSIGSLEAYSINYAMTSNSIDKITSEIGADFEDIYIPTADSIVETKTSSVPDFEIYYDATYKKHYNTEYSYITSFDDFKEARTKDAIRNPEKEISLSDEDLKADFESFLKFKGCRSADDLRIFKRGAGPLDMHRVFDCIRDGVELLYCSHSGFSIDKDKFVNLTEELFANASPEELLKLYESCQSYERLPMLEGFQQLLLTAGSYLSPEDFDYLSAIFEKLKEQFLEEAKKMAEEAVSEGEDKIISNTPNAANSLKQLQVKNYLNKAQMS